jgi:hypothetical protein
MIDAIKNWFFYRDFKPNQKVPAKEKVNNGNSICILFDGTDEEERKIIYQFKKTLNPTGQKQVKSLAFINNALPLDNVDYAAYNLKNLSWYGKPFGAKLEEFIHLKYDLLIVLCKVMLPHFEYIMAYSEAGFKVGPDLTKCEKYLDLMVGFNEGDSTKVLIQKIVAAIDKIAIKS